MASAESRHTTSPNNESGNGPDRRFEAAHGELRLAIIQAIARRVGKSVVPISVQESRSEVPLTYLYHRKAHTSLFADVVERLLFRWWR
jgi:hypothetical protein